MAEERYTFAQARTRLEEIVAQVRKKDTSLEKSLDLLEEGVRLANTCTELSDHTEWQDVVTDDSAAGGYEEATERLAEPGEGPAESEAGERPEAEDEASPGDAVDSDPPA